jgi:hypothetical protein
MLFQPPRHAQFEDEPAASFIDPDSYFPVPGVVGDLLQLHLPHGDLALEVEIHEDGGREL